MAWSGLTGYILCCQLNNFMANVAYIFWFNTACANKDFLLLYYSMSKRYVEILQESYWQKGQVHFLKKHQKNPCWLERAQFLPSLPNTTQPFAPTTTPQPWNQPFNISKPLLPFVYPSSAPQLHLPMIFTPKNPLSWQLSERSHTHGMKPTGHEHRASPWTETLPHISETRPSQH